MSLEEVESPLFVWGDEYQTGVESIDQQHQKLVNMINALHAAFQQDYGPAILQPIFNHLSDYLLEHIAYEEALLEKHNYPEFRQHQQAHSSFNSELKRQKQLFEQVGSDQRVVVRELLDFLKEWFAGHVLVTDMAYAPFIRDCMEQQEQRKPRILAVDDEQEVLNLYQHILGGQKEERREKLNNLFQSPVEPASETRGTGSAQFESSVAKQGQDAIELMRDGVEKDNPFQVAFIDMRMPPGINGLETARALRMLDEDIYIVFVTAYSDKSIHDLDRVMYHDVLLLRKPFISEEIFQMALSLSRSWQKDRRLEASVSRSEMELALNNERFRNRMTQSRLDYLQQHDPLTGLPNQTLLLQQLHQRRLDLSADDAALVLLVFEVKGVEEIRTVHGNRAIEQVQTGVRRSLQQWQQNHGSHEAYPALIKEGLYALLLCSTTSVDRAFQLVAELQQEIHRHPMDLQPDGSGIESPGAAVDIKTRFGFTLTDNSSDIDSEVLINQAITAMNRQQSVDPQIHCFEQSMSRQAAELLQLRAALREALPQQQLLLYYQPKVEKISHRLVGMEALLRWNHPQQGVVAPAQFIELLESEEEMLAVGEWVLQQGCRQTAVWNALGEPLQLSVNVSARQLQAGTLPVVVERTLQQSGLPAAQLELEITESLFVESDRSIMEQLEQLQQMGVRLALDDFGTGYSSLSYLSRFSVQTLKIDRAFVVDLVEDPRAEILLKAIIAMAHALKIEVVVEGVERVDQLERVETLGGDQIQGYLFSRPLSVEQFTQMLERLDLPRQLVNNTSLS